MTVPVLNIKKEQVAEIELPEVFKTPVRHDVIKKAVIALQSTRFQPQGRDPMAGKRTTAESRGTGYGIARVPRLKGGNRAAFGVSIVGGHAAFPPKSEKVIVKRINKKERRFAIRSGIAASAVMELVVNRGHKLTDVEHLPLVIEDEMESLEKTKDVKELFQALGVWSDVERADRRKIRAGKGKMRGRKRKLGKGPLIVIAEDKGIGKAARNIPGVDIVDVKSLNAELLAPGAHPGRLVIWGKTAFESLDEVWEV
ncbi:MAG: 50S ribosomal protein L4 [Candidatus Bathyarchaeota archaeon]|nr:50S ribosomal protein L4 [Candidatus Bathyarchaeota archaeon]